MCPGCGSDRLDAPFEAAGRIDGALSLAVSQHGALLREAYFHGHGRDSASDVRSVTKSVVALTVGAAIERGCMPGLDATLTEALGPLAPADAAKAAITIADLLSMTSGFQWLELGGRDYDNWASAPDQVAYVLSRGLAATPGQRFCYDSGAFHLLSVALTRGCGPTSGTAAELLLRPLDISSRDWETDNQGFNNGSAGLYLTAREMLDVGRLVLEHGTVGPTRLVPSAFVEAATSTQIATGDPGAMAPGYGYGWWVGETAAGAAYVMAAGWGGQFIVVVPGADAVIAATTTWQGVSQAAASEHFVRMGSVIRDDIVPLL